MTSVSEVPPPVAYFWGEDAYRLDRAARDYAAELAAASGAPYDVWRTSGDEEDAISAGDGAARRRARLLDEVMQRLGTGSLFGAGTLVLLRQPGSLLREAAARQRLLGAPAGIAPGNALCFLDLTAAGGRGPAGGGALRDAVAAAGGRVAEFPSLSRERMEAWLEKRATELDTQLGPGAARLLAERVGAHVREGDVDRRRQSELADAELQKLALYRPGDRVSREDVAELVTEAVPGSAWAMLDAIGSRRGREASALLERLLAAATPLPVLIAQLHRRLRELIVVREHLDAGTRPPDLVRALKVQPFRAQKLAEQARAWSSGDLESALDGLLELDLLSKGLAADGSPRSLSEERSKLALLAWVALHAPRPVPATARG